MPGAILFVHRWLGVLVGALMTLWCLSGFVMMYSPYPQLAPAEALRGLAPLRSTGAQALARIPLAPDAALASVALEALAGRPVLRVAPADGPPVVYDLAAGAVLAPLTAAQALAAGGSFGRHAGIAGRATAATPVSIDQWTIQAARRSQPLYRIDFADPAGTTVYVAGNRGAVVQQTTRTERFWGWLGAVPHWLYPTLLRQNGPLWTQVVIWTSLAGCFLTLTGLWTGIARLRRRPGGGIGSPYRGLGLWHHLSGLFFGVLALGWVASGLVSMNPWGFLESAAGDAEQAQLAGPMRWGEIRAALAALDALPPGTVRVASAPLAGQVHLVAVSRDGTQNRFDAQGRPAPLRREALAAALAKGLPLETLTLLRAEDDYYYAHKAPIRLPVWRAQLADAQATRLYIDPDSGALLGAVDGNARGYRWLHNGLHSLDVPMLRARPWWDLVVLALLAGVTLLCATGTWLGFRKAGRDLRRLR